MNGFVRHFGIALALTIAYILGIISIPMKEMAGIIIVIFMMLTFSTNLGLTYLSHQTEDDSKEWNEKG